MRVMVTGALGFLGSHVVKQLENEGYAVIGVGRRNDTGCVACDLSQADDVVTLLDQVKPDCVVNCAATVDFGTSDLEALKPVNTDLPAVIARWLKKTGGYLVQASGTIVHGSHCQHIDASTPTEPNNNYGVSKLMAEDEILRSGVEAVNLRLAGIYGQGGPAHLGLNRAIDNALNGEVPAIYGQGVGRRNYIYVKDAALAVSHCLKERVTGAHLAAGQEVLSISEMMHSICRELLPGQEPTYIDGNEAFDQIVEPSAELPQTRSFQEALQGMLRT